MSPQDTPRQVCTCSTRLARSQGTRRLEKLEIGETGETVSPLVSPKLGFLLVGETHLAPNLNAFDFACTTPQAQLRAAFHAYIAAVKAVCGQMSPCLGACVSRWHHVGPHRPFL